MKRYFAFLLFSTFVAIPGCASVGLPTPTTFNQNMAVAITAVTTVRTTAQALLQAKKISADDAQNVQDGANSARTGLDIARTLSKVDMTAATNKLAAASTALSALNTYLATRK